MSISAIPAISISALMILNTKAVILVLVSTDIPGMINTIGYIGISKIPPICQPYPQYFLPSLSTVKVVELVCLFVGTVL